MAGGVQMSQADQTLEEREKELSNRIQTLERQLERISAHISDGNSTDSDSGPAATSAARSKESAFDEIGDVSEEVLNWVKRASLLPRLSALCFLLVVALIFRTVTDSGLIDKLIGSGLGMSYAAILMVASWYQYRKQSPLAPVFAACGTTLMATIVVETHAHFQSLPLVPAYLTLMASGIIMAFISRQFNVLLPIAVGTLCMCIAGSAIDYPLPFFPYLSMLLFTANVLGYFANRITRCSWLRWTVLVVTMTMLQLWALRLGLLLKRGEIPTHELAITWFLPILSMFAVTYIVLALFGIVRDSAEKISWFDLALPTLNAIWAFACALYVVRSWDGSTRLLGTIGVLIALSLLAATFWIARRAYNGSPGASSFTFASGALLALALPSAIGAFALSLPAISLVGIFMAVMSRVWGSGTIRVTTYLFHFYCCGAMVFALRGDSPAALDAVNILPSGLLACIILYQYQWCRWWSPPTGSSFFGRFDPHDRSAVILLLGGLICGFFMMRITFFQAITMVPAEMQRDAFRCSQSVLVNCSAIALILFAYLKQNREIRNVAILVMVIGGIKVFLYDLMGTHGLPLVFSVFSFGMAAAVVSIALGKWQKQPAA